MRMEPWWECIRNFRRASFFDMALRTTLTSLLWGEVGITIIFYHWHVLLCATWTPTTQGYVRLTEENINNCYNSTLNIIGLVFNTTYKSLKLWTKKHLNTWCWNQIFEKEARQDPLLSSVIEMFSELKSLQYWTCCALPKWKNTIPWVLFEGSVCQDLLCLQTGKQTAIQKSEYQTFLNNPTEFRMWAKTQRPETRTAIFSRSLPSQALPSVVVMKPISHSQRKPPGTFRQWPFSHRLPFSAHSSLSAVITYIAGKHKMHSRIF